MRIAIRVLLGIGAVLVLAVVALAIAIPRIAQRPEVRDEIARAAREATGRELRFGALEAGLLPPRLIVEAPELVAAKGQAPLRAERIALRIALLPLLARTLAIDSLELEGGELTVVRTKDGIELPVKLAPDEAAAEPEAEAEAAPVDLAIRGLRLERTRLTFVDRAVSPATTWELTDVNARARGRLVGGTLDFEAGAKLASGGELSLTGEYASDGPLAMKLTLAAFPPASAASYLPADLKTKGDLAVEMELSGPTDALSGPLSLDFDALEIAFGDSFRKPAGETLRVTGTLALAGEGIALRDGELRLRDLRAPLAVETLPATRVSLAKGELDLAGWDAILPALAGLGLGGKLGFEALELGIDPLSLRGKIALDGVTMALAEDQNATLSMQLEASGDAIRGKGPVVIAKQEVQVELGVTNLAREMRLALRAKADDLDSEALAVAFGAPSGSITGPLDLSVDLGAPLGGEASLVDALSGPVVFAIAPGRMPGVSLLRSAIDALGGISAAAALTGKLDSGGNLQKFYEDEFEKLGGSFMLGGGKAHTEDLALLYRSYRVDLAGDVALADTALDLDGTLTIYEEVDQAIAGAAASDPTASPPQRAVKRELPLAHVGGTASDPKVSITPKGALAFTAAYLGGGKVQKLLDEKVGPGAGSVIDSIGSLFGGKKSKAEE